MKVAVDVFNLGLLQGTGIATYSRELCHVLSNAGHEVFSLFGLRKVDASSVNAWAEFYSDYLFMVSKPTDISC